MIGLAFKQLLDRPVALALNSLIIALSSALLMTLAVLSGHIAERFSRDTARIDLVVGAKGSPLQVILSTLYHVDAPTGNIPLKAMALLEKDPTVAAVIPIAIGDRFRGYRVVGTRGAYIGLYEGQLGQGEMFQAEDEAVIGAHVAKSLDMTLGQAFVLSHGLGDASLSAHDQHPLRVTGVLKPTGSVLDRLIIAPLEAVWEAHGIDLPHDMDRDHDHGHETRPRNASIAPDQTSDITALLVQYASPLAAVRLPQFINTQTPYVAAVPAQETARLLSLFGFGRMTLLLISWSLAGLGALAIFAALWSTLDQRMADMAMLRVLGARPWQLFSCLVWEGVITAGLGAALGFVVTRAIITGLVNTQASLAETGLSETTVTAVEVWIMSGIALLGGLAALIPAVKAARVPIARAWRGTLMNAHIIKSLAMLMAALFSQPASAIEPVETPPALEDIWEPAKTPEGGVSWKVLETTEELQRTDEEGYLISRPAFSAQVKALEGKRIKVAGWMMPLENGNEQRHFVLLGYPPGCPFHMHAGPRQFIEVRTTIAIATQVWDPIVIEGTLTLTGQEETGVFYQIADGRMRAD